MTVATCRSSAASRRWPQRDLDGPPAALYEALGVRGCRRPTSRADTWCVRRAATRGLGKASSGPSSASSASRSGCSIGPTSRITAIVAPTRHRRRPSRAVRDVPLGRHPGARSRVSSSTSPGPDSPVLSGGSSISTARRLSNSKPAGFSPKTTRGRPARPQLADGDPSAGARRPASRRPVTLVGRPPPPTRASASWTAGTEPSRRAW